MHNAAENIAYIGGALGSVAGNLASSVVNYTNAKPESNLCTMGCAEILRVSNALQGIFSSSDDLAPEMPELPQIGTAHEPWRCCHRVSYCAVVIGSQSSGKSSLLNGIMAVTCTKAQLVGE